MYVCTGGGGADERGYMYIVGELKYSLLAATLEHACRYVGKGGGGKGEGTNEAT
jgi:hypothetical protein